MPDGARMSWLNEACSGHVDFTSHGQITRVEVVDHRPEEKPSRVYPERRGRVFAVRDAETVVISIQDDGRTLKLFIS